MASEYTPFTDELIDVVRAQVVPACRFRKNKFSDIYKFANQLPYTLV
jgi:hypothetical protein